jgi:hypothetical protein
MTELVLSEVLLPWTEISKQDRVRLTNADFIREAFQDVPMGARVLTCSIEGDPSQAPGWPPIPADIAEIERAQLVNAYVSSGTFRPDSNGQFKAAKPSCAACHALLLDDLNQKVSLERIKHFQPSWVIETSPGNFQAGIILKTPEKDLDMVAAVHRGLIAAGFCDPGAGGVGTRWMRLPVGVNGKSQHQIDGKPFNCRIRVWNPKARYTLTEIREAFQLQELPRKSSDWIPSSADDDGPISLRTVQELRALLSVIDPDCSYHEWLNVLLALHHETSGSDAGLELADAWSSSGTKYKGRQELEIKWRSFRDYGGRPVTLATILKMVQEAGADWMELLDALEPPFEPCETVIVEVPKTGQIEAAPARAVSGSILTRYSVRDRLADLEKSVIDQKPAFGDIVLLGQATVIYAAPNTGKTLVMLALCLDAINKKRIDPAKLFYINMDDNSTGLLEKARLANEYGFEMLADGHRGFRSEKLREAMIEMSESDAAKGMVIVLDTLKKFTNTMDKTLVSEFNKIVRRFVLKGGTVVALSHTNKKPGPDGEPVYTGTTDVLDDFDCGYTVKALDAAPTASERIVQFRNIKRRGDVPLVAAYRYAWGNGVAYAELLASVEPVSVDDLEPLAAVAEQRSDAEIIAAIAKTIREGVDTKMKIVDGVARMVNVSRRAIIKTLVKYTGDDPAIHKWKIVKGDRNAFHHVLHPALPIGEPTG